MRITSNTLASVIFPLTEAAGDKGYTREDLVNDILATYFPSTTKPSLILKTLQNAIKSTLQDKDYSDDPYAQKLLTQLKVNPVFWIDVVLQKIL